MSEIARDPLRSGVTFHDRYEIVRVLKAGGMGTVYEVLDRVTHRSRALKTMHPELLADAGLRERFSLEATVAAEVDSEHIVEVFDAGIDASTQTPYLVMELLKGEDLGAILEKRGRLAAVEVIQLLAQVALALDKTHAAQIVHRDLKPENLFVTIRDDGFPRVKVLDFGIAKVLSMSTAAKTTRNVGTPLYMSPEQIRGDARIGTASDRYAVAQIVYTLLVGEPYWEPEARTLGHVAPVLMRVLAGCEEAATKRAFDRGVSLPQAFDPWFARGCAVEPQNRFDSVAEMISGLAAVFEVQCQSGRPLAFDSAPVISARGNGVTATSMEPSGNVNRRIQVPRWALGVGALLALGGGAAFVHYQTTGAESQTMKGGPTTRSLVTSPTIPLPSNARETVTVSSVPSANRVTVVNDAVTSITTKPRSVTVSKGRTAAPSVKPIADPTDIR